MKTVVLFPGAWGNNPNVARFWVKNIIDYLGTDWRVIVAEYSGTNLFEAAAHAGKQLRELQVSGAIAIPYSAGGHVYRLVAAKNPTMFNHTIGIGIPGRHGMSRMGFIRVALTLLLPFTRSIIGSILRWNIRSQFVTITSRRQLAKLLFNGKYCPGEERLEKILNHSHPEPFMICLQLSAPGFRITAPKIQVPGVVIMPEHDLFFREAEFAGDKMKRITVVGAGHGLPLQRNELWAALDHATEILKLKDIRRR